jgi:DNA gyrase subunit A
MTLDGPDDEVVSMDLADDSATLLTVTENGFGKRTEYSEYPAHRRGGKGVITIVTNARNGFVSKVKSVAEDDELMFTSAEGIIIRMPARDISVQGRNTQGVRVMNLKPGDKVVGVARIKAETEEEKQLKLASFKAQKGRKSEETLEEELETSEDEAEDAEALEDLEELEDFEESEETDEEEPEEE